MYAIRSYYDLIGDELPLETLAQLVRTAFCFPAPLVKVSERQYALELFHGPTLAFKDFALQLLGRLMDHVLAERGERLVIMGATSGDTGSAAIEGCRRNNFV